MMSNGKIKVRVVRQVEGKKIGDEFECYPDEYRLQIKHKSIEVIGDDGNAPAGNGALTKPKIIDRLTELKVEHDPRANKDVLVALLDEAEAKAKAASGTGTATQ
jgi:hypothetical protein